MRSKGLVGNTTSGVHLQHWITMKLVGFLLSYRPNGLSLWGIATHVYLNWHTLGESLLSSLDLSLDLCTAPGWPILNDHWPLVPFERHAF